MTGAMPIKSLRSDAGTSLLFMHCCVREAHHKCGAIKACYEAGVLAGAAGVAAGALAGVADVLVDELDESDVLGVALEVDAGVVLLEVDLLSVL